MFWLPPYRSSYRYPHERWAGAARAVYHVELGDIAESVGIPGVFAQRTTMEATVGKVLVGPMVMGFYFSESREQVLLIRKTHPEWMAGKLNGVGGGLTAAEIEVGRAGPWQAMVREFREETGIETHAGDWVQRGTISGRNTRGSWHVQLFAAYGDLTQGRTMTDEQVYVADVRGLGDDVLPNLRWIIPAMLDEELAHVTGVYR